MAGAKTRHRASSATPTRLHRKPPRQGCGPTHPRTRLSLAAALAIGLATARGAAQPVQPSGSRPDSGVRPVLEVRLSMSPAAAEALSEPRVRRLIEIELEDGVLAPATGGP